MVTAEVTEVRSLVGEASYYITIDGAGPADVEEALGDGGRSDRTSIEEGQIVVTFIEYVESITLKMNDGTEVIVNMNEF